MKKQAGPTNMTHSPSTAQPSISTASIGWGRGGGGGLGAWNLDWGPSFPTSPEPEDAQGKTQTLVPVLQGGLYRSPSAKTPESLTPCLLLFL